MCDGRKYHGRTQTMEVEKGGLWKARGFKKEWPKKALVREWHLSKKWEVDEGDGHIKLKKTIQAEATVDAKIIMGPSI